MREDSGLKSVKDRRICEEKIMLIMMKNHFAFVHD